MAKTGHVVRYFIKLAAVGFSIFEIIPRLFYLFEREIAYEKKRLILFAVLCCVAGVVLLSIWLCILAVIFIYLAELHFSPLASIMLVTLINIIIFCLMMAFICKQKAALFERTRKVMQMIIKI